MEVVRIGGYAITAATGAALAQELTRRLQAGDRTTLLFANVHFIATCTHLRERFESLDAIIANDGLGMDIASVLAFGKFFPENLNGTDFIPKFLEGNALRTFLVGGSTHAVQGAARALPNVIGYLDGYNGLLGAIATINDRKPDVLLVGLGNPYQEEWIVENRGRLEVPLVVAVGGLFDFLAGDKRRAPSSVRRMRLEWLFRWLREPKRMFRRNTLSVLQFAWVCWCERQGRTPKRRAERWR